jgi:hypothetical protein
MDNLEKLTTLGTQDTGRRQTQLCLVYPMLPVYLGCPFLITPSVFSSFFLLCLSSSCVLCTKLPTLGTQDTGRRQTQQIKVRENRRSNQEWTT